MCDWNLNSIAYSLVIVSRVAGGEGHVRKGLSACGLVTSCSDMKVDVLVEYALGCFGSRFCSCYCSDSLDRDFSPLGRLKSEEAVCLRFHPPEGLSHGETERENECEKFTSGITFEGCCKCSVMRAKQGTGFCVND